MERDIWSGMMRVLKNVAPTWPPKAVYNDTEVLCVVLWAALHDRPISWACCRSNWPLQAWRRQLPSQPTTSRRMRRPEFIKLLHEILPLFQTKITDPDRYLIVDGKALELSENTRDPDARTGRGVSGFAKGYKLHALIDSDWNVLAWELHPLNEAESTVAVGLLRSVAKHRPDCLDPHLLLLADAGYDSNKLYMEAAIAGVQMIAPRRKPNRGLSPRKHHRNRLKSIDILEGQGARHRREWHQELRGGIERYFGALASSGCGLSHLPTWVRRTHRCEIWVGAKLIINAVRLKLTAVAA